MLINNVYCLFEQSGTFKKQFLQAGINAFDIDISDLFSETDFIIDLFDEIKKAYSFESSIFDNFTENDLLFAFFPCTYFESQSQLWFSGHNFAQRKWSISEKCQYCIDRHNSLNDFYIVLNMLVIVCCRKNLRLIIENPYSQPNYLTLFWCVAPTIIHHDRRNDGDFYKKPTQYFFVNCSPENNIIFECLDYVPCKNVCKIKRNGEQSKIVRSLIHPQYAARFIKKYIL